MILGLSSILVISNGLILDCTYGSRDLGSIGDIYTCTARVIFVRDDRVDDVSSNHEDGYTHDDVKGLIIEQSLAFTPRDIELFFPNLEAYVSKSTGSANLTRESLIGLSKLRLLDFGSNNLAEVENDLFSGNPSMEWIYFDSNPIKHIAHHVFDHLNELRTLYMSNTACINQTADNMDNVRILQFRLIVNCPPTFHMTETKIVNGTTLQNQIDERIEIAVDPVYEMLREIEEHQDELRERIEVLESDAI